MQRQAISLPTSTSLYFFAPLPPCVPMEEALGYVIISLTHLRTAVLLLVPSTFRSKRFCSLCPEMQTPEAQCPGPLSLQGSDGPEIPMTSSFLLALPSSSKSLSLLSNSPYQLSSRPALLLLLCSFRIKSPI